MKFREESKGPDHEGRYTIFSQAFRTMHFMPARRLRQAERLYNTIFMGERSHDAGGPYRESFSVYCAELESEVLPLLIPCNNQRDRVGQNREKWVLSPGASSPTQLQMFAFLGKLMGIAVRTKVYLQLNLPALIWKLLVGDAPGLEDLEAVDLQTVQSLQRLRNIHTMGVDEDTFEDVIFQSFTTVSADGRTVPLVPNGENIDVTFGNRNEYCDLVVAYKLGEFALQAAAVRGGLATQVPVRLLSLFTWDDLERFVCGNPVIDLELLRSATTYNSCSDSDGHVRFLWEALESFDQAERSQFLRFVWGRSRLPVTRADFKQQFTVQNFSRSPPDSYLPVAHTCFFSLELPRYSSVEIMQQKLRYAIENCTAIDADDTGTAVSTAAMGWED